MNNTELKQRREALKLTQKEMAAVLGVSRRSYEGWEAGRRDAPRGLTELALRYIEANPDLIEKVKPLTHS